MTTPPGPPPYGPPPYGQPYGPSAGQPYGPPAGQPYGQPGMNPYPPPPPPPYSPQSPGYYAPPQQKPTNWWAIVSLIFGLIGGVVISVVCGIVGLRKAKQGQGGRGLAIAGLVLSAVWVVVAIIIVIFVIAFDNGTVTATDVKVGDCLKEIPRDARVQTVQTVDCSEKHAGEVFAVLQMPDGDFPGQPAIDEYTAKCSPALAAYAPKAMQDDSVQMYVLYPTTETWAQGDRAVTCIATLNPPRTGSIKG